MVERLLVVACGVSLFGSLSAQTCVPQVKFPPTTKVPILGVAFQSAPLISQQEQEEITKAATDSEVASPRSKKNFDAVADEAAERTRAAYQNQGYFKVVLAGKALPVASDPLGRYNIAIRVVDAGKQYRLGDLNVVRATAFSEAQLRDLFLLQRGEIFSREKIAKGLEALRRFYGSQGYINFTAVPETEFDDDSSVMNLTINADEGKQFRLRSVEVLGVESETKARILENLDMKPGEIFSSEAWESSYAKFRDLAQNPNPNAVDKRLDERDGWVDIVVDFRKRIVCPAPEYACEFKGSLGLCRPQPGSQ